MVNEYEALAIPGGFEEYGFYEKAYDERFLELIREFHSKRKIIASICVGSLPIGKSGVLKNRVATTYHLNNGYRQKQLAEFALLSLLVGSGRAEVVKIAMGFGNGKSL